MKYEKNKIPAAGILLIAVLAAVGSQSFLGACVHEDGTFGACHWAAQALTGIHILLICQSILVFLCKENAGKRAVYICMVMTSLLALFIPGTLIHLCMMASMRCRALMRPAMAVLDSLAGILSITGLALSLERTKKTGGNK